MEKIIKKNQLPKMVNKRVELKNRKLIQKIVMWKKLKTKIQHILKKLLKITLNWNKTLQRKF